MKRAVVEALMAGALVFLLIRLPVDLLLFRPVADPLFLTAPPGGIGPEQAEGMTTLASLSWWAAGAVALLVMIGWGVRRADMRHEDSLRRMNVRAMGRTAMAASAAGGGKSDPAWRPRANPYFAGARGHRVRKIVDARTRRSPRPVRRPS